MSFVAMSVSLGWSAVMHYRLWHDLGYRHIPTIGALFVAHAVVGVVLAVLALVFRRTWTALVAGTFALATMLAFLVAVTHGLFGFRESWAAPDARSAFLSAALVVIFGALAVALERTRRPTRTRRAPVARGASGHLRSGR